jgi:hypothetical protein
MDTPLFENIPSESVCNFFYWFSVAYAVIVLVSVLSLAYTLVTTKLKTPMSLGISLYQILVIALGSVSLMFNYLICDRALLAKSGGKEGFFGGKKATRGY